MLAQCSPAWLKMHMSWCTRLTIMVRHSGNGHVLAAAARIQILCCWLLTGQGKSEPKEEKGRCYINEFDDLVVDAIQYLDTVLPKHPDVPWICAGHSLGGLVAVHVLLRRPKGLSGLVLHSAAIGEFYVLCSALHPQHWSLTPLTPPACCWSQMLSGRRC